MFSAMKFSSQQLSLLDQRHLPSQVNWLVCRDLESVAVAIESMVVRGAPAIATAAAYGLALDLGQVQGEDLQWRHYEERWFAGIRRLEQTRPTAVNLHHAMTKARRLAESFTADQALSDILRVAVAFAERLRSEDFRTCQAIGDHGAALFTDPVRALTHCNTGSLATAGYGTALGVIRSLHKQGKLSHVWVDETRPYLQGARLTAFELREEGIPFSVNVDSAAAFAMQLGKVDFVVVGADRIVANGDTANKVGTYSLAVLAQYHKIPFYVAAPLSTFDGGLDSGRDIPIEERPAREITHFGESLITVEGAKVWNPSFDITPAELITAFITEFGVIRPPYGPAIAQILKEAGR